MKSLTPAILTLSTLIFASSSAHSDAQRSVDVRNFDIAGVRTGMDYDEARKAAARHFQVGIDKIEPEKFPGENIVTKTKIPTSFSYEDHGITLQVHFEVRIPVNESHLLAVSMIKYEIPWSPENKARLREAALEKYGQPSTGPIPVVWEWCESPHKNIGMACSEKEAVLSVAPSSIELTDRRYTEDRIRYVRSLSAVRPSF